MFFYISDLLISFSNVAKTYFTFHKQSLTLKQIYCFSLQSLHGSIHALLFLFLLQMKKELSDNESISQEVVGNAHIENYALKLFLYADNEDRAGRFHKWEPSRFLICLCACV